ncbi:L-aspartate oxidase [Parvularcula sp. ZS-1/3]|uniref:L-aspartate oxidase n=1 Tax=Parvularcula mediterranea TaxID=2732508 RepID=A0A7Y3RL40_9PROT|nr:L-aspartate oxidase [Parvularcula mediterranea]
MLIIGAGIAGLWTALQLRPLPVTVITAGKLGQGSSSWAQGGLAAAVGGDDTPALHAADTIEAGAGLCDRRAVDILCTDGPDAVEALAELGVPFDRNDDGSLKVGREAAHGQDRIVHVGGDEAGAAIMRCLTEAAEAAESITIRERTAAYRINTDAHGNACGASALDIEKGEPVTFEASSVVLATGGIGGLYAVTTNPLSSQGHGIAMAALAGAALRDLEFVQFHPTALHVGRDPAPLATEAIRGAGGTLLDNDGERFMLALHRDAELAPRDVVARGVASAIKRTGAAFLDVRGELGDRFAEAFPTVFAACEAAGLNPATDLLPIAPAAHYHMGGIMTDTEGRSSLPGLFAVGECASTGVHGANRLASNSLLEAIVFGSRAAKVLSREKGAVGEPSETQQSSLEIGPAMDLSDVRRLMASEAGILRIASGLRDAERHLAQKEAQSSGEEMALLTARLVLEAARAREESRGAHQRSDYPETSEAALHSLINLKPDGTISVGFEEVRP